jgi:hypothetical protein
MARRLPALRASGLPFGFIFTLTQHNLHEVEWVTRFALDEGAGLLQIHPLETVGRAARTLPRSGPDETELSYAVLAAARAQDIAGETLRIQLDVAGREAMQEAPERVYAGDRWPSAQRPLSELLSPLIIEADGTLVPIEYGFARRYALGRLQEARLPALAARWRREREAEFRALCREVYAEATAPMHAPVVDWYGLVSRRANGASACAPGHLDV